MSTEPTPTTTADPPDLRDVREAELATIEVPTLTPRAQQIVEVALDLLEEHGPEGVSMRIVAGHLGVRAPSLYKHLSDKQSMENAMIAIGLRRLGLACGRGGERSPEDPLGGVVDGFRRWALEHRHLYALMMSAPLDSGPLVRAAELLAGRPLRDAMDGDAVGALTIWSFAHGLVTLEMQGRLPAIADVEELWRRGVDALRPPD